MVSHTIRQQDRLGLSDIEASWLPVALYVQTLSYQMVLYNRYL